MDSYNLSFRTIILLLAWCIVEASHDRHRRFLFGGRLEDHVPQECTHFSEFVDVYDVYTQWINHGQYVYLKLASIQAKTLRHEQLNTEEQAYAPLLTKLSANKSSEFGQTYETFAGIQEYGHEFCVAILQFGIVQVLMKHESELCQQFLAMDSVSAASVCTPATPNPVLISCKQCNDSACSGDNMSVVCDVDQMCLISVKDSIGDRRVYRGCVDSDACIQEQKANGGYLNYCTHVNDGPLGFPATCNFCCNKTNCNSGVSLVPDRNSLFFADLSS